MVANKPPTLCMQKPLMISPKPSRVTPMNAVHRAPISLIILALNIARTAIHIGVRPPTKLKVAALERPPSTSAFWMTPHEYEVPANQKQMTADAKITTQPYPPSGIVKSSSRARACSERGDCERSLRRERTDDDSAWLMLGCTCSRNSNAKVSIVRDMFDCSLGETSLFERYSLNMGKDLPSHEDCQ
jgi:hypothetical protein